MGPPSFHGTVWQMDAIPFERRILKWIFQLIRSWCFSGRTVRCLGGLSGATLLGMTKEELKTLCPEEGGRVFFQLQMVQSAKAVRETPVMSMSMLLHLTGLTGFYSGCQLKEHPRRNHRGTNDWLNSTHRMLILKI